MDTAHSFKIKHFDELTPKELYEILRIRSDVFIDEQQIEHNDIDGLDPYCTHVFLEDDNKNVIAYCRAVPKGKSHEHAAFGRVCVRKECRGSGLAKKLITAVIKCIEEIYGEKEIEIGAQAYLKKFYESFGFTDVSDVFLIGGIEHVVMIKKN